MTSDDSGGTDPVDLERIAVAIARETAELARSVRERVVGDARALDTKSSATDVVTEGDRACEELVRARLAELRPGDAVLGEEGGAVGESPAGAVRWVVDPIDGTVNYTHGLPWYAVSLGAEIDGLAVAGAVVEPASGRVWSAARGHGARCDDRPLRLAPPPRLELAVVATGLGYDPARRVRQAGLIARLAGEIGDVRRVGCASLDLCSVAAGWTDAYYEHGLHRWDWCAAALVAEEAGAVVRRPRDDGADPEGLGATAVLAAAPPLAADLTALLVGHGAAAT